MGASVFLTGSLQLAATQDERRDIGGALADALQSFDEASPFLKLLNVLGPWSGVIDGLAQAIYDRIVYVADHRVGRTAGAEPPVDRGRAAVSTPPPSVNGARRYVEDDEDEIRAPNPAGGV